MNFTMHPEQAGVPLVILVALWGLFIPIFWMVVGWRAMRAHEALASANRQLADEVHRWRRSAEEGLAPKAVAPPASAAEEARAAEMLMTREWNP
jgi:hypothetical protein